MTIPVLAAAAADGSGEVRVMGRGAQGKGMYVRHLGLQVAVRKSSSSRSRSVQLPAAARFALTMPGGLTPSSLPLPTHRLRAGGAAAALPALHGRCAAEAH